jgi:hypothetical protein
MTPSTEFRQTPNRNICYDKEHSRIEGQYRVYAASLAYQGACAVCGDAFRASNASARYCSSRCANDASLARRKMRIELSHKKRCSHCQHDFAATRNDAKFCSAKCKQAAHRVTHKGFSNISATASRNNNKA